MPFINLRPADTVAAQCIVEDRRISHALSPVVAHISNLFPRTPLCNATRPSSYSRRAAAISPATPIASHPFSRRARPIIITAIHVCSSRSRPCATALHHDRCRTRRYIIILLYILYIGMYLSVLIRCSGFSRRVYYAFFAFGVYRAACDNNNTNEVYAIRESIICKFQERKHIAFSQATRKELIKDGIVWQNCKNSRILVETLVLIFKTYYDSFTYLL